MSALEMPQAPAQPGWDSPQTPVSSPVVLHWNSARLGNTRRVWVFTTGDAQPDDRPLAVLLDGQFWAQSMPVWPALTSLTQWGQLPAAVYLLIDAIDTTHRSRELPCNADFWLAVQHSYCRRSGTLRHSAIVLSARSLQGKVLAGCHRCLPGCTGRSALAACSASPVLTGGPIAAVNRTG